MCLPNSSACFFADLCSRQRLRLSFTSRMPTVIWVGRRDRIGTGWRSGSRVLAMTSPLARFALKPVPLCHDGRGDQMPARPLKEIRERFDSMASSPNERMSKARIVRLGGREVITEGLSLSFWADISHRCMTASWPAFIGGAALVFVIFNAVFAVFYWIGDLPISNVPRGDYIDYL